jgi:pyruvate formate lyase activating enzyme
VIPSGGFGNCGVRGNKNGNGLIPFYGHITALALDPIEKKPLYHFRPGSMILSAGFLGCNLRCPFCQNWHISQAAVSGDIGGNGRQMRPEDLVSAALSQDSGAIAYTYSEPLVHVEFLLDCMELAHKHGIANVLVTNGCVNAGAAREILSLTDAANIDLKCFSPDTYAETLGGGCKNFTTEYTEYTEEREKTIKTLCSSVVEYSSRTSPMETVLGFIRLAREKGVHIEITTLVVPGLNDTEAELDACANFVASLNDDSTGIPWHLSAYHPEYRWNAPPTDPGFLLRTKKRAAGKLRYVYAGNIQGEENNTVCPGCGAVLVRRMGYRVETGGLVQPDEGGNFYRCGSCGDKTGIRL